jgi:ankyrin repeat protein
MSNKNDTETSLLIALLQEYDYDAAKKLLNVNPSCCYDIDKETSMIALYFALESTEMTQLLLNLNPDSIRFKTKIGNLPLHYACQKNCLLQTIQLLLDIDPSAASVKNNDGKLPLHYSSSVGISANKYVIELLIKKFPLGISEKENKNNSYPLHYACAFKAPHDVILKLLLSSPLMCRECDKSGNLPIHLAIIYGLQSPSILSIIDSYRDCVFKHDSKGRLPLHLASQFNCHHSIMSIIIDANRNALYEKDKLERTPLLISIKYNLSCESLECLVKNDNTLYNNDYNGDDQIQASYGVIHMAISYGCSYKIIKIIADLAPQTVIQLSGDGKLPIHVAIWQRADIDVVKVLIEAYPEGLL